MLCDTSWESALGVAACCMVTLKKNEHLTGFLCFAHSCVPSLRGLSFLPHRAQRRVNCQHVQGHSSSFCIPPYCWANTLNFPLSLLLFSGAFIKLLSYIALCLGPILQLPLHMHNYWIISKEPSILELISSGIFCHQQLKKIIKRRLCWSHSLAIKSCLSRQPLLILQLTILFACF